MWLFVCQSRVRLLCGLAASSTNIDCINRSNIFLLTGYQLFKKQDAQSNTTIEGDIWCKFQSYVVQAAKQCEKISAAGYYCTKRKLGRNWRKVENTIKELPSNKCANHCQKTRRWAQNRVKNSGMGDIWCDRILKRALIRLKASEWAPGGRSGWHPPKVFTLPPEICVANHCVPCVTGYRTLGTRLIVRLLSIFSNNAKLSRKQRVRRMIWYNGRMAISLNHQ